MAHNMVFDTQENKNLFFNMLRVLGGREAVVNFQGGGDSGEIECGVLYDAANQVINIDDITFDWTKSSDEFNHETQEWATKTREMPMGLSNILRDITESLLEKVGLDWYNNDGGQGHLTIDLTQSPPTVTLYVGVNETITHDYEFNYTDSEEEDEETVTSEEDK
jgi:hypothetical protein